MKNSFGAEKMLEGKPASEGQFHGPEVATISAAHFVHDTYMCSLPPLLPILIRNLLLSKTDAGLLSVFTQLPSLLQPFIGHFADRADLRYAIILAPAVSATLMSLLGIAPGYGALAALVLAAGISSAFLHAVGPVLSGRRSGSRLGFGLSIWLTGGELGRAVAPLVIVAGIGLFGIRGLPWLMLGGWLVSGLLWLRYRRTAVQVHPVTGNFDWRGALRSMTPVLLPVACIQLARSFMVGGFQTYLPVLLTEEGSTLTSAGVSLSIMQVAGVVGAMLGGWFSDRVGRKAVLAINLLAGPAMLFAFLSGGRLQILALVGVGFVLLSLTPVLMAIVQESFPQNRALGNGIYQFFSFTIQSLATLLVGVMGDAWGLRSAYQVTGFIMLAGLPFILLLPKRMNANKP